MNPQLLGDTNFQNKKSVFANQAISNAVSMCDNTINVITLMVSFIANTIVFCFFIDPIYLIAIIIVIIAAAYQIKFSVKKRRDINLKLQRIDADVHGSLLSG
ncbi:hypothetical protein FACS1894166_09270 [Bacilli bacterium]|nr:hypothetical protein FACS1894166_09270 [Bacilli bacterium]